MTSLRERLSGLGPRERALLVVGGIIGLLVVVYFLVARSGGGPEPVVARTQTPRPSTRASASPTPSPSGAPEVFASFGGKDPFKPLVGPPVPGGSPAPAPGATPGPSGGPSSGQRVELLDIFTESGTRFATVSVDDREFKVKAGDTFAGSYRVLSLTSDCGNFVFGDERFTLCIGQEVLK
jgi:hypothetical protein